MISTISTILVGIVELVIFTISTKLVGLVGVVTSAVGVRCWSLLVGLVTQLLDGGIVTCRRVYSHDIGGRRVAVTRWYRDLKVVVARTKRAGYGRSALAVTRSLRLRLEV